MGNCSNCCGLSQTSEADVSKKDTERIAKLMGAKIVGHVGNIGHGVFGAWRLAKIYEEHMAALRCQEAALKAPPDARQLELSVSAPVAEFLGQMAAEASKLLGKPLECTDVAGAILEAALLEALKSPGSEPADAATQAKNFVESLGRVLVERRKGA